MNGIFNYHVPGVSSQQCNCTAQDTSPASKDAAKDFKNAMPWENSDSGAGDLLKALYSLLQELVGELNNGGDKPGLTTYAVGEEDGGGLKPPPPPGGEIKPPIDVITQAFPEDGGGLKPPPPPGGEIKPPIDVITQAFPEDGGGLKPPPPPGGMTTMAMGEEDGGGLKPPDPPPMIHPMDDGGLQADELNGTDMGWDGGATGLAGSIGQRE